MSQLTDELMDELTDEDIKTIQLEKLSTTILYELWFSVAESIFKRVCEVTELDKEEIDALRVVALRPNDFQIDII